MEDNQSPVLFLMGTTATGKTELACELYDCLSCELISVDAAQVYMEMDIGTAKPDKNFLEKYPHHLIDICQVDQSYSAALFCRDAKKLIRDISERGKLPILVGGTMFYFAALQKGLSNLPESEKWTRDQVAQQIMNDGLAKCHARLAEIDPTLACRIEPSDRQRIQRGLEIYMLTRRIPSQLMKTQGLSALPNPVVKCGLFFSARKKLHQRIEWRFKQMLEQGLLREIQDLKSSYPDLVQYPSMKTVGYRQTLAHLEFQTSVEDLVEKSVAATRQLAKRQLTWLRNQSNIVWFDMDHHKAKMAFLSYMNTHPLLSKYLN